MPLHCYCNSHANGRSPCTATNPHFTPPGFSLSLPLSLLLLNLLLRLFLCLPVFLPLTLSLRLSLSLSPSLSLSLSLSLCPSLPPSLPPSLSLSRPFPPQLIHLFLPETSSKFRLQPQALLAFPPFRCHATHQSIAGCRRAVQKSFAVKSASSRPTTERTAHTAAAQPLHLPGDTQTPTSLSATQPLTPWRDLTKPSLTKLNLTSADPSVCAEIIKRCYPKNTHGTHSKISGHHAYHNASPFLPGDLR